MSANYTRYLVLAGLVVAALLEVMDTTIVNVALPQMAGELGATSTQIAWVSTGYTLANAVVLPMTAWLSARLGRKRYLLASVCAFTVGSVLCGISQSLTEIVLWRVVQGASGAALISTAQAVVVQIFPREQQGTVQSVFGLSLLAVPAVAPWIGGWITDHYSWPWVFFVNVPIGIVAAFLIGVFFQEDAESSKTDKTPADWAGICFLTVGLGALQFVLEEGQRRDWFEDRTIVLLSIIAFIALVALIIWELCPTNTHPIVDLRIYRERSLTGGVSLDFATGLGMYGVAFILPQFSQNTLGLTPTAAGAALIPEGLATVAAVAICGILLNRNVDPRPLIGLGIVLASAGTGCLMHLTSQSGIEDMQLGLILEGAGIGFLIIPVSVASFGDLRGAQIDQGAAQLGLGRQLGGAFGVAILSTCVSHMTAQHRAVLVTHIVSGSQPLSERLSLISEGFVSHGVNVAQAQDDALRIIDNTVHIQAMTLAYLDAFFVICVSYLLSIPLIMLLKHGRSDLPAHH